MELSYDIGPEYGTLETLLERIMTDDRINELKAKDEACTGVTHVDLSQPATYDRTIAGIPVSTGKENPLPDNLFNASHTDKLEQSDGTPGDPKTYLRF